MIAPTPRGRRRGEVRSRSRPSSTAHQEGRLEPGRRSTPGTGTGTMRSASSDAATCCRGQGRAPCSPLARARAEEAAIVIKLSVNGKERPVDVQPDMPLLWVLRETLGLTGT